MKSFFVNLDAKTKKIILIAIICIVSIIVLIIGIHVYHLIFGTMVSYNKLESIVENSAIKYFSTDDRLPQNEGESKVVDTNTLISEKYMREMDKYTKDTGCIGNVTVTNNGGNYQYVTNLKCNDYKTTTIANKIMSTIVDSGDGLYLSDNTYYYRGEYVNNYISINNVLYRIIEIDASGNMKLIDLNNIKDLGSSWDDRFNTEKNISGIGINDFEKSRVKEKILSDYEKKDNLLKKYILNYDWCVGKRPDEDLSLSSTNECITTSKLFVGLLIPYEYSRISLDTNCSTINSSSCVNYNYLANEVSSYNVWTLTGSQNNTYFLYSINRGIVVNDAYAVNLNKIIDVFYISGNNVYLSGDGTSGSPYLIK